MSDVLTQARTPTDSEVAAGTAAFIAGKGTGDETTIALLRAFDQFSYRAAPRILALAYREAAQRVAAGALTWPMAHDPWKTDPRPLFIGWLESLATALEEGTK